LLAESLQDFDPRVANAMGHLASVLLKALENGRIEFGWPVWKQL
jgi:hypothetical protein